MLEDDIRYEVVSGQIIEGLMQEAVLLRFQVRPYAPGSTPAPNGEVLELVLDLSLAERLAEVLAYLSGSTSESPDSEVEGQHEF